MLAPASYHGTVALPALLEDEASLQVLGDGAYHHPLREPVLAEKRAIRVLAPPRKNSPTL